MMCRRRLSWAWTTEPGLPKLFSSWREDDLETFHLLLYTVCKRGGGGPPRTLCFSFIGVSCHIWCARPHRQNRYVTSERWDKRRRRLKESLFPELRFDSRSFRQAQPRISAALAAGGKGAGADVNRLKFPISSQTVFLPRSLGEVD